MKFRRLHPAAIAAAKASISTATAYRFEKDPRPPSMKKRGRRCRRQPDVLNGLFEDEVVPILQAAPGIRSVAIFEKLLFRHPYLGDGVRRTVERRIRKWRAEHGAEQEVIFRQVHQPGRLGLSDFTVMNDYGVTIAGQKLDHMLYHFRLAYSGFEHAHVILGGESYVALAEGLQNALWALGGAPEQHRTDSLSAAFRNLDRDAKKDLTWRYEDLCRHYGMRPTRNNPAISHENGSIESPHGHLKRAIEDALLLRGSRDFADLTSYRRFIDEIVQRGNARKFKAIEIERKELSDLPMFKATEYEEHVVRVTSSSSFVLKKVLYTVESRLINYRLRIRLYDDRLEVFLGATHLTTLPRGRAQANGRRAHVVNYRHVIHSLRRKPGALPGLVYRDQLWPREEFRQTYDWLMRELPERQACRLSLELLFLAHERGCESELVQALSNCLKTKTIPDLDQLRTQFSSPVRELPEVSVTLSSLDAYQALLENPDYRKEEKNV